jgi:hypothetical protein
VETDRRVVAWVDEPGHRRRLRYLHWVYAWLLGANGTNGRLAFHDDGIWFEPDWVERRVFGMQGRRLVAWEDVSAIDLPRSSLRLTFLGIFGPDRTYRPIGQVVGSRCDDHLFHYGFEPHVIASWPDRRLWTRAGHPPDWTLLRP